ncbi:MAG: ATP-binding protein [Thermoplasmata archaeon]
MVGGNRIKLTVNERILLHLRRYYTPKNEVEVPQAVTQMGIADAIDIRVTHVPRSVKKLDEEGLIYESVMHIEGLDKRRKAYFLTEKGMYHANDIKRNLEERMVPFKDPNGKVKEVKITELRDIIGIKLDVLDLVRLVDREGVLNKRTMEILAKSKKSETQKATTLFDFPHKVPVARDFVGRKEEIDTLNKWIRDEGIVLISLHGNAGMGKSYLVAKVIFDLKDKISIFWFGFGKVEGFEEMVEHLSEFFARLNRAELKTVLRTKEKRLQAILKGTITALSGTNALLVFDALDEADTRSKRFLELLSLDLDAMSGAKIIIMYRGPAKLFAKEAIDSEHFKEMQLSGLDRKSCKTLLGLKKLQKGEFERIFRLTEGNPLVLKLIKLEDVRELEKSGKYTPDELTLIKYLKSLDKI